MIQEVKKAWFNLQEKIEKENIPLSSEKTLVFLYAIELMKLFNCKDIIMDFECQLYVDIDTSDKYLDLLIIHNHREYAIEFKAPMKSIKGNSNQTETRKKIYKDIARLKYLVEYKGIEKGFFFMITDEAPYFNKSDRRDNTFDTSNGHNGNLSEFIKNYKIENINFTFSWRNIHHKKVSNKFAWLKPIEI